MRPEAQVYESLKKLFPDATIMISTHGGAMVANINAEPGSNGVWLRFKDMPKIAEAFGTERLDFQAITGADHMDSFTFDGTLLNIIARDATKE